MKTLLTYILALLSLLVSGQKKLVGLYTDSGEFTGIVIEYLELFPGNTFSYYGYGHAWGHIAAYGSYKYKNGILEISYKKILADTNRSNRLILLSDSVQLPNQYLVKKDKNWLLGTDDMLIKCGKTSGYQTHSWFDIKYWEKKNRIFLKRRFRICKNSITNYQVTNLELSPKETGIWESFLRNEQDKVN